MITLLVIAGIVAVILVIYAFVSSSGGVKSAQQLEDELSPEEEVMLSKVKQEVVPPKEEPERVEAELDLETHALKPEELQEKSTSDLDLLKAENASLKSTLMTKENENKRLADENKALKKKIEELQTQTKPVREPKPKIEEKLEYPEEPPEPEST